LQLVVVAVRVLVAPRLERRRVVVVGHGREQARAVSALGGGGEVVVRAESA
ncbi:hypothetical protein E4U41_004265, partial [Claviceps citrina]